MTLATSCRACLKESMELYFEMDKQCHFSQGNQIFLDIFNLCTHLKVQLNDGLPQRICELCVQELRQTYSFLQKVLASEKKLIEVNKKYHDEQKNEMAIIRDCDDSVRKDPLESLIDNEENSIKNSTIEILEHYYESSRSSSRFDNTNNVNKEYLDVSKPFTSPQSVTVHKSAHHESDDSENTNDGDEDFFKSVESQIFPQGRLRCKICQKSYFTNVGLEAHMDIHLPKAKTLNKDTLKTTFTDVNYLKSNKGITKTVNVALKDNVDNDSHNISTKILKDENKCRKIRPKKLFPCQVCGKQMISASKLRYHMVMHTGEKDYLCTMCPKAYSTIYALKHHLRAHTGERPYECKFCGDRFLRPTTLKSHMRRHTGERPYGCDICGKRFIQHSSMATHMKLNHMDKTIPCPYCDKKYARQTDLNTHLLSHSGDKPFACRLCPSRFTRQSNLNKHMNQHHNGGSNMVGDKKITNKTINDDVKTKKPKEGKKLFSQEIENSNDVLCMFEKPSCSSFNIKADTLSSTSLIQLRSGSLSKANFQQASASVAIDLSDNEFNNWSWPNQT